MQASKKNLVLVFFLFLNASCLVEVQLLTLACFHCISPEDLARKIQTWIADAGFLLSDLYLPYIN